MYCQEQWAATALPPNTCCSHVDAVLVACHAEAKESNWQVLRQQSWAEDRAQFCLLQLPLQLEEEFVSAGMSVEAGPAGCQEREGTVRQPV